MESYTICIFVTGLFHLTWCPQDSSAMEHVTELPSFLRLNTIPLYVRTTSDIHSSVHEQMDAFYIWPLWILLQWTWVYNNMFRSLLSVLWGICQEVELLDHVVILFLTFWGISMPFSIVAVPFCFPTSSAQGFQLLHVLTNTYFGFS